MHWLMILLIFMCSFIVEFMTREADPARDSDSVQKFLTVTEGAFQAHPLFINATDEELDAAGEVFLPPPTSM